VEWAWIDALREAVSGERARGVKLVTRDLCASHGTHPDFPHLPAAFVVEGAAQLAGLLVGEATGFARNVVLAKVARARFHRLALPGDGLDFAVAIAASSDEGALCRARVTVGDELLAEIELVLDVPRELRDPCNRPVGVVVFGPHNAAIRDDFVRLCEVARAV